MASPLPQLPQLTTVPSARPAAPTCSLQPHTHNYVSAAWLGYSSSAVESNQARFQLCHHATLHCHSPCHSATCSGKLAPWTTVSLILSASLDRQPLSGKHSCPAVSLPAPAPAPACCSLHPSDMKALVATAGRREFGEWLLPDQRWQAAHLQRHHSIL